MKTIKNITLSMAVPQLNHVPSHWLESKAKIPKTCFAKFKTATRCLLKFTEDPYPFCS